MTRVFVTVGAQTAFDRLVQTVDEWARGQEGCEVFVQIGASEFRPQHAGWAQFLTPTEFIEHYRRADLIVAHAGTGSILQALQLEKPIVVLPRRAALRETRNDHQLATARFFERRGIRVAWTEADLVDALNAAREITSAEVVGPHASPELIAAVREFISSGRLPPATEPGSGPRGAS